MICINGTMVNYFFNCKRQCYFFGNQFCMEDESELVAIGRVLHESKEKDKKKNEIQIDNIRIDYMDSNFIIERKKSDSNAEAAKWQLLFYLKKLKEKGIVRKGKLEFFEKKKKETKIEILELTEEIEKELDKIEREIQSLIISNEIPQVLDQAKCKKCAYFDYCYI